jgi:tetratricopeptide (TPR) repeat protein
MPHAGLLLALFLLNGGTEGQFFGPRPWFDPTCPRSWPSRPLNQEPVRVRPPMEGLTQLSNCPPGVQLPRPFLSAVAQAHQVGKTKLRKLAYLPQVYVQWKWELGTIGLDPQATAKRIVVLEKKLQGDDADAERYAELAELYEDDTRPEEVCDGAYAKASQLFQERIKREPGNGWLHAQLALVLWPNAVAMEAEALEAVRYSPRDYRCWRALGQSRVQRVIQPFIGIEQGSLLAKRLTWDQLFELIPAEQLSPDQLKQTESRLQEASKCFDKAVSLAPEEPEAYQWRLTFQYAAFCFRLMLSGLQPQLLADCCRGFQDSDIFNDARDIVRLRPDDPESLDQQAYMYWLAAMYIEGGKTKPPETASDEDDIFDVCDHLSNEAKKNIALSVKSLEKLAKSDQPGPAASACRHLALCFAFLGDIGKAEVQSTRAIELEPTCEESWDSLLTCRRSQDKKDHGRRTYEVCKQKLRYFPTPRTQLFLARECVDLQLLDEAEGALRTALKDHPDDIPCWLGLTATLLLKDDRPETVAEVRRILNQMLKVVPQGNDKDQRAELVFLEATCEALEGQTDLSFRLFKSMASNHPRKPLVQKALALFDAVDP